MNEILRLAQEDTIIFRVCGNRLVHHCENGNPFFAI